MLARCLLVALNLPLLDVRPFWLATILVLANNAALVWTWRRSPEGSRSIARGARGFSRASAVVAALGAALVFIAARAWLREIILFPHDPQRADMLVVIQLGIRRLLQGRNPYTMYRVPWPATLPYGPVMWVPMIVPLLLHADVRFSTVAGALFVAAVCAIAAFDAARRGRRLAAGGLLIVLLAMVLNPDIRHFMSIGHTPAYWPLLPLFAWFVAREQWVAAAIVCGLLIVARTTMVALAPILLIAVWYRARARTAPVAAALGAAVALPLLPFLIADWRALRYAFYGSYQEVIKGFVWSSTDWVQNTVGVTGLLLTHGWHSAVEPVQALAMIAAAGVAWRRIRKGDAPLPWMAVALLIFSMTTLWPVVYIYFDVFVLLVGAVVAQEMDVDRLGIARRWLRPAALALGVLLATTAAIIPLHASVDAGAAAARPLLYSGFSGDEHADGRTYAWVDGTRARVLLPSLSRVDAVVELTCLPYIAVPGGRQQLTATLNGTLVGSVDLGDGWQTVRLRAPAGVWQIGVNELELFLASATAPRDIGEGGDTRRLSIAIDRVNVDPR